LFFLLFDTKIYIAEHATTKKKGEIKELLSKGGLKLLFSRSPTGY
jgi:hypothetical protein